MFFALTSFLFTDRALRRGLDSKDFYIGRARRIVPLYLFVATCTVLMSLTKSSAFLQNPAQTLVSIIDVYLFGFTSSLTDPALMLNGVNTASLIGIAWSLVFEWKFYLVFPALYFLVKSSRTLGLALILVLVVIAARDFYQITEAVWPFFLSGALIAYLKNSFPTLENLSPSTKKALALLSVPALVVVLAIPGNWGAGQLVSATVLFFLVMFGEPKLLKVRNLRTIGVISYSIYLIQYLVLAPVSNKAHSLGIVDASPTWKFIAAFSVPILLVAFSCLTYKYIERPWMSSKKHGSAPDSSATRDLPAN